MAHSYVVFSEQSKVIKRSGASNNLNATIFTDCTPPPSSILACTRAVNLKVLSRLNIQQRRTSVGASQISSHHTHLYIQSLEN